MLLQPDAHRQRRRSSGRLHALCVAAHPSKLIGELPKSRRVLLDFVLDLVQLELGHGDGFLVLRDGLEEAARVRMQVGDVLSTDPHTLPLALCRRTVEALRLGDLHESDGGRQRVQNLLVLETQVAHHCCDCADQVFDLFARRVLRKELRTHHHICGRGCVVLVLQRQQRSCRCLLLVLQVAFILGIVVIVIVKVIRHCLLLLLIVLLRLILLLRKQTVRQLHAVQKRRNC